LATARRKKRVVKKEPAWPKDLPKLPFDLQAYLLHDCCDEGILDLNNFLLAHTESAAKAVLLVIKPRVKQARENLKDDLEGHKRRLILEKEGIEKIIGKKIEIDLSSAKI
jgi:hypothetical protein